MRSLPTALWHTLPLHYIPYLFYTGVLCSQAELVRRGYPVRPRPSAARRDRKLHLNDYVHLSPVPVTPLLRDKCARGYGHGLVAFDTNLLEKEGVALCRFNAKSWRHRDDFAPVTDKAETADIWEQWRLGRFPSLEVLVPRALPLVPQAQVLHLPDVWAADWLDGFTELLKGTILPRHVTPTHFPGLATYDADALTAYKEQCLSAGTIQSPPDVPFD